MSDELAFLKEVFKKYSNSPQPKLLEPACGTGRLMIPLIREGFDCSGFINYIFGSFGFSLVRTSYSLAELGETVTLSEIQPGDLMFFRGSSNSGGVGHVGMVIEVTPDAINFIHSSTNKGVTINNFKTSKYYISHYVKSKRLDYGVSKQVKKN